MIINKDINNLLDKLVALELTNGVQPHDLAEAIFDTPYSAISSVKNTSCVVTEVTFVEHDENHSSTQHVMRYTYSLDRKLQTIEQKIGRSRYKLQWSREAAVAELIGQLRIVFRNAGNREQAIREFLDTIPETISEPISNYLKAI